MLKRRSNFQQPDKTARACMKNNFFDRAYDKSLSLIMISCPAFPRHGEAKRNIGVKILDNAFIISKQ